MSTHRENRALFARLFQEGRFIPKIQELADAASLDRPGTTGESCTVCLSAAATCPVCNRCFKDHHVSDHSLSLNSVCVHCGEALALGEMIGTAVEILPCPECYPNMFASDLKDTTYYFQI
ncbi:MAG TPA: hypothetical protein VKC61_16180 [Pyrinomonadaceae bacterium]|nr:hypothetical protein [Pyrinomonadaceae bacterium]